MVVEELIGKVGFKVDGLNKLKDAEKAMQRLRDSLKDSSTALRSGLSVPASNLNAMAKGFDRSSVAARRLRSEVERTATAIRRSNLAVEANASSKPGRGSSAAQKRAEREALAIEVSHTRMVEAARARQRAKEAQTEINDRLGVKRPKAGSARASAAVFGARARDEELTSRAGLREDSARSRMIERARSRQAAQNAQVEINERLGVRKPRRGSARASASAFKDEGGGEKEPRERKGGPIASVRSGIGSTIGMGRAVAGGAAAYAAVRSIKSFAEAERAITRIGITAEATDAEIANVGKTALRIAQETSQPYENVVQGLDTMVAQGRSLKDSMAFLPAVAKTAQAAGAEVTDIARSADAVGTHLKVPAEEMEKAFDQMATAGKLGQFELKDMARYLPSLLPSAKAAGFEGNKGLSDLVSMLQVMRKGSGTGEEAATSMSDVLQKMESKTTIKKFDELLGEGKAEKAFAAARKEGENLVVVFERLAKAAIKGDISKLPQLIQDKEFARGARALLSMEGQWQNYSKTVSAANGTVEEDLARVNKNTQAGLDRLANNAADTGRSIGGALSTLANPVLEWYNQKSSENKEKLDEAKAKGWDSRLGRNVLGPFNRHVLGVPDTDQNLLSDPVRQAREAKLLRDRIDEAQKGIDFEIGTHRARLDTAPRKGSMYSTERRAAAERRVAQLEEEKAAIDKAVEAYDDMQAKVDEVTATRKRAAATSLSKKMDEAGPITSPALVAFGVRGAAQVSTGEATALPGDKAPLPPSRPAGLTQGIDRISQVLAEIETKSVAAGDALKTNLNVTVTPNVDLTQLEALISMTAKAKAAIMSLGSTTGGGAGLQKGSNAFTGASATTP